MDSDDRAVHLAAAKRQFTTQHNHHYQLDGFNVEDFDGEEEGRPNYLCPYCYVEFHIESLCSHLETEHSYESKSTVCPICSVKVVGDMISHLRLQHGHLFKFQRFGGLCRVPFPNSQALSLRRRDLRKAHLGVLLGDRGIRSNHAASSTAATDNLFSSLDFPTSENDDVSNSLMSSLEENSAKNAAPQHMWKSSLLSSLSGEEREQRMRQACGRAVFVQDLLASALLADK